MFHIERLRLISFKKKDFNTYYNREDQNNIQIWRLPKSWINYWI